MPNIKTQSMRRLSLPVCTVERGARKAPILIWSIGGRFFWNSRNGKGREGKGFVGVKFGLLYTENVEVAGVGVDADADADGGGRCLCWI